MLPKKSWEEIEKYEFYSLYFHNIRKMAQEREIIIKNYFLCIVNTALPTNEQGG